MRSVVITCEDLIAAGVWQPGCCAEEAHSNEGGMLVHIVPWKRRPHFPNPGLQRTRVRAAVCINAARMLYQLPSPEWARAARVARARERAVARMVG